MNPRTTALLAVAAVLLAGAPSRASGLHVTRFSGEHGHPTTANPTAIYFNPAGLALRAGHRALLEISLGVNMASYERFPEALSTQPPSPEALAANTGEATLTNVGFVPFAGFVTDFGTGAPFGVGVAFYAPFGGQSVFDRVEPVPGLPGSEDGPQRWWNIEGTMQTLALSLGGAYRIESLRLSIGVAGNLFFSTIDALQAQNADGTDDPQTVNGTLKEGRARVEAHSTDWGAAFGILWEPIEGALWVGASYQSRPNFGADMELEGTIDNVLGTAAASRSDLIVRQQMPDTLRLGLRYRPSEVVELRLFGDWTRWSAFEGQCFVNTDVEDDPERACRFNADGSQVHPDALVVWNTVRRWQDTFGVRLGASWWPFRHVELMVGAGFDRNAIPDETLEAGLLDFDIITATLGGRLQVTPWLAGMLTVTNWFALERDTRGETTFSSLSPPSRQPNSAGIYNQNILTFNFGLEMAFGAQTSDEPPPAD